MCRVRDENAGAISREPAGERDGEAVASPSERKRARGEAESRPLRSEFFEKFMSVFNC